MGISVNKPVKDYLKRCFEDWFTNEIQKPLEDKEDLEDEELIIKPVDLSFLVLKELGAKCLVGMFEHVCENPQFIINDFIHSGITTALFSLITATA